VKFLIKLANSSLVSKFGADCREISTFKHTSGTVPQGSACSRRKRGGESLTWRLLSFLSPQERGHAPELGQS